MNNDMEIPSGEAGRMDVSQLVDELSAEQLDLLIRQLQAGQEAPRQSGPAPRQRTGDTFPLSFGQQQLWFLEQLAPGTPVYNLPAGLRLEGDLDLDALAWSLGEIVRRHEALRTRFALAGGRPVQIPFPLPASGLPLPLYDLAGLPEAHRDEEHRRLGHAEAVRPFDLETGPLLRASVVRLAPRRHLLLLNMHHIGSDAWSLDLLVRELAQLYSARLAGLPSPLPELPLQYVDFAQWQRERLQGEVLDELLRFWTTHLAGRPAVLDLPVDRPRPPLQVFRGGRRPVVFAPAVIEELRRAAAAEGASLFMALLAGFFLLLQRHTGQDDVLVGTPMANRVAAEFEPVIGLFVNTLVLRCDLSDAPTFRGLLARVRETALAAFAHEELPFQRLVEALQPERDLSRSPLFQVLFALQNAPLPALELPGLTAVPVELHAGTSQFDLALSLTESPAAVDGWFEYDTNLFDDATAARLAARLATLMAAVVAAPARPVGDLPLLSAAERHQALVEWNDTRAPGTAAACVHELFEAQAARTPSAPAMHAGGNLLTYGELDERADRLARALARLGVRPGDRVGVCVERGLDTPVALLGVLKAGAAYVPLDPAYPEARLTGMLDDSGASVLVAGGQRGMRLGHGRVKVLLAGEAAAADDGNGALERARVTPDHPSYVIYTSGSTGKPKGVVVRHREVANLFRDMDARLDGDRPGVWLALTSISFDISVLELLWTLTRGFEVVLQPEASQAARAASPARTASRPMDFSLFYFADAGGSADDRYRLLLEGARFADEHGFKAVWTPERHFHSFGGLYPNPSVTGAAVAAVTRRVEIRAGSVVLPLHDPIRVAEEWSVVDNISRGRAAVSFASGWHADDFVLAPERYASRKDVLLRGIEEVRQLWRGGKVRRRNGTGEEVEVGILPPPVQPELPIWLTAAGSPDTFRIAGEIGANILTHLLGQSVEEVAEKVVVYREARSKAGLDPAAGVVTLMLHTFVGPDEDVVRELVREPFRQYLRSSVGLLANLARGLGRREIDDLSPQEMDALLDHASERYFATSALFGTPERCRGMVERLQAIGVDEIGCLIDFGVAFGPAMESLQELAALRLACSTQDEGADPVLSIAEQVGRYGVTHMQCTPSMARMIAADPEALASLRPLRKLLVGGEALPADLADRLVAAVDGDVLNVYGPTETTVWSLSGRVAGGEETVSIGRPMRNTAAYLLDGGLQPVPTGVPGEVYLGGDGVAAGYWLRPDLTADRFVPDPLGGTPGGRLYRTGDRARHRTDGRLEFLGRVDHQVKVRGHRIELGEIEAALRGHPAVADVAVMAREDHGLVAYLVPAGRESEPPLPPISELRRYLAARLPEPMIPAAFVTLDALPLTANGKLDRRGLPAPGGDRPRSEVPYVPPQTRDEEAIAAIWREVLQRDQVGVHDNFFEAGGNSLLLVEAHSRLKEKLGRDLELVQLFRHPTVHSLAAFLSGQQGGASRLEEVDDRARLQAQAMASDGAVDRQRQFLAERKQRRAGQPRRTAP